MRALNFDHGPQRLITAKLVEERLEPFRILRFENFFSAEMCWYFEEEFRRRVGAGSYFKRSEAKVGKGDNVNQYGAMVSRIHERETSALSVFYSRVLFDYMQRMFSFPLDGNVQAAIHHHPVASPTGWIHSDYHNCNFTNNPTAEGINPWSPGTNYQFGWDPRPEVLKCYRSVAILYYFANEEWRSGDGGETCFFSKCDWKDIFMKAPPVNNTLVAFEVSPKSWHTFITNTRTTRTSIAMWYHSSHDVALERYGEKPHVSDQAK